LEDAWLAYLHGEAGDAGIVDCISFAVMHRLGLTQVFTNDRHFQAAGSPSCSEISRVVPLSASCRPCFEPSGCQRGLPPSLGSAAGLGACPGFSLDGCHWDLQ
jgi:hypothetical protein